MALECWCLEVYERGRLTMRAAFDSELAAFNACVAVETTRKKAALCCWDLCSLNVLRKDVQEA